MALFDDLTKKAAKFTINYILPIQKIDEINQRIENLKSSLEKE